MDDSKDFELDLNRNTGIIINPINPLDWVAGGETGAVKKVLFEDGQADAYLPTIDETQAIYGLDVLACVTFSATSDLETKFNYYLKNNLFSQKTIDFLKNEGYIGADGTINFSDRFTARMSGTTKNGNSLEAVADSIRKFHGLVPEADWPAPKEMLSESDPSKKWDIYYQLPPQDVQDKGKRFLEHITIQREWTVLSGITQDAEKAIKDNLKYGPMQIAAAVCSPWMSNDGQTPIQGCGCTTQHGTIIYGYKDGEYWKDYDHYKSYRKKLG